MRGDLGRRKVFRGTGVALACALLTAGCGSDKQPTESGTGSTSGNSTGDASTGDETSSSSSTGSSTTEEPTTTTTTPTTTTETTESPTTDSSGGTTEDPTEGI